MKSHHPSRKSHQRDATTDMSASTSALDALEHSILDSITTLNMLDQFIKAEMPDNEGLKANMCVSLHRIACLTVCLTVHPQGTHPITSRCLHSRCLVPSVLRPPFVRAPSPNVATTCPLLQQQAGGRVERRANCRRKCECGHSTGTG